MRMSQKRFSTCRPPQSQAFDHKGYKLVISPENGKARRWQVTRDEAVLATGLADRVARPSQSSFRVALAEAQTAVDQLLEAHGI